MLQLVHKIDQMIIAGNMLGYCVGQDFNVRAEGNGVVHVSDNPQLLQAFAKTISTGLARCLATIGSDSETDEALQIVGLMGLYILLR